MDRAIGLAQRRRIAFPMREILRQRIVADQREQPGEIARDDATNLPRGQLLAASVYRYHLAAIRLSLRENPILRHVHDRAAERRPFDAPADEQAHSFAKAPDHVAIAPDPLRDEEAVVVAQARLDDLQIAHATFAQPDHGSERLVFHGSFAEA